MNGDLARLAALVRNGNALKHYALAFLATSEPGPGLAGVFLIAAPEHA